MSKSQEALKRFISEKSRYFQIRENEEKTVKYLSSEIVPNYFSKDKSSLIRYHFEEDGIHKFFDRTSKELAIQMSEIPEGSVISIKRTGQGNKTKYLVVKLES